MMLWNMEYGIGFSIYADVIFISTTDLNYAKGHIHPFMSTVFLNGSGFFRQNNMCKLYRTVKIFLHTPRFMTIINDDFDV